MAAGAGLLLAGAGLGLSFLVHYSASQKTYNGKKAAGTVNGEPFFAEDVDVYAQEWRAAVAASYGKKYNLSGVGAKFWDTRYGNSTPRETMRKLALDELVRNMVLIQEARRRGIDTPASYHDLESEREEWNAPTDEIVYGPKTLASAEYNSYRITGIRDELKTALLKKELTPTAAQLREVFAALPDEMKMAPYRASGIRFKWNAGDPSPKQQIRAALLEGRTPEEVVRSLAGSVPGLMQEDFAIESNYISKEDEYEQEIGYAMKDAVAGSIISGSGDPPELYYVTATEGGGILTFEQAPLLARNKWINDQFDHFLDKKVKSARIMFFK
jgi:hypothetical protein